MDAQGQRSVATDVDSDARQRRGERAGRVLEARGCNRKNVCGPGLKRSYDCDDGGTPVLSWNVHRGHRGPRPREAGRHPCRCMLLLFALGCCRYVALGSWGDVSGWLGNVGSNGNARKQMGQTRRIANGAWSIGLVRPSRSLVINLPKSVTEKVSVAT